MASLDRMDTDSEYNSSDGESSDEENSWKILSSRKIKHVDSRGRVR